MNITKINAVTSLQRKPSSSVIRDIGEALIPAGEKTIQFAKKAPLAAGATALSFGALLSAMTGTLSLVTVFGSSAVALFACQIFNLIGFQSKDR